MQAQNILANSLSIKNGQFSNDSTANDAAFVIFSKNSKLVVPFGTLNSNKNVSNTFLQMTSWQKQFGDFGYNYSAALQLVDNHIFDYGNDRAKMLIVIGDNTDQ